MDHIQVARKLKSLGMTISRISSAFDRSERTTYRWMQLPLAIRKNKTGRPRIIDDCKAIHP